MTSMPRDIYVVYTLVFSLRTEWTMEQPASARGLVNLYPPP